MTFNPEYQIDVSHLDVRKLVRAAYDNSRPQGLGFLHAKDGTLTDEEVDEIVQSDGTASMDYVNGRSCKFHIYADGDQRYINKSWYDHTDEQLQTVLAAGAE